MWKKSVRVPLLIFVTTFLLLGIPRLAGLAADVFEYRGIDPDGAYAWVSVHHIIQAVIVLVIMVLTKRLWSIDYSFGRGNTAVGNRYVKRFSLFFGIYLMGAYVTSILTGSLQPFAYPMTPINIMGQMGFQILLSGPSEELIFRAFAITILGLGTKKRIFSDRISLANLIAAIIFGLAHVQIIFTPLSASFSPFQILYAFVLGLFYGDCYEKSGNVIYPMMMHSMSNAAMVGIGIIMTWLAF